MPETFFFDDQGLNSIDLPRLLLSLLLAFLAGQLMAWVYMLTHSGLSYSRTFVHSLVLIPVTVSLVMSVLDNNLVTAFSLMGIFAIVRFRNIIRDTLDTVFVMTLIVVGMAAGTQLYATTVVGTLLFAALQLYLRFTHFGNRQRFDFIVNLHWEGPGEDLDPLAAVLNKYCMKVNLARHRALPGEQGLDLSYRLLMRNPKTSGEMLEDLGRTHGVSRLTGLFAGEESEV